MTTARAPECDPESRLLLGFVARQGEAKQRQHETHELGRGRVPEHEVTDGTVPAGEITQLWDVERILHEAHIEDDVRRGRETVLVPEALEMDEHRALPRPVQRVQRVTKILHRQIRRIDHLVGACAQVHEQTPLLVDRRLHPTGRVDRVTMTSLAVAAEQDIV